MFNSYAVNLIRKKARQLTGRAGFTEADQEDLEQELHLDLFLRLHKFNPQKSSRNTFITRVVNHKIATILESRNGEKRDFRLCTYSFDTTLGSTPADQPNNRQETTMEEYLIRTGRLRSQEMHSHELTVDIRRVMVDLPQDLQDLCKQLMTKTVSEVSRDTGIPRPTIYDRMKRIAARFEDARLRDYLESKPTL